MVKPACTTITLLTIRRVVKNKKQQHIFNRTQNITDYIPTNTDIYVYK